MNRSIYFNYIEEKLNTLSYRVYIRGKINLLDLNIYSESFFAELMNHLLGYNLENINAISQNMEGIDLIDFKNKVVVQVSATCSKQKIESSLKKKILENYKDFQFKFVAISGMADKLRTASFSNPYHIEFSPKDDIYDIKSILNILINMEIKEQYLLYEFIKDELGCSVDMVKVDSNLAGIINILFQDDLTPPSEYPEINSFEIQRKIDFNELSMVQPVIDDYKVYYSRINEKYEEFDKQGVNKSLSVLSTIRQEYVNLSIKIKDTNELFLSIIDGLVDRIMNSRNYIEIPYDELEMCVSILVVDAFTRCKIFKNPEGYDYAVTR